MEGRRSIKASSAVLEIIVGLVLALTASLSASDVNTPAASTSSIAFDRTTQQRNVGDQGTWRYSVVPEDTIWSISNAYLADKYTWVDLIRFNHLQNASQVKAGTTLFIPFPWLKHRPAPAIALSVSGEALLKRSQDPQWVNLEHDFYLHVGDTIKTFKGSVLVKFADDSVLRLEEDTVLVFNRLTQFGKSGMTDTGLRLEKGRVSTKVKPNRENGSRYEISTPSAVAAVRGTEFRVDADTKKTALEVIEGVVEFSVRDNKIDVPAGYAVSTGLGNTLSPVEALLEPPTPENLPKEAETLPVSFFWSPVKGANKYKYSVYADSETGEQVLSGVSPSPSFQVGHLNNGNYLVTMRGITEQGIEGIDATHLVHIGISAKPVLLTSPLPDQIFNQIQPTFRWTDPHENQKARLEIAQNEQFDPVIVESNYLSSTYTNLDFKLPPGSYFWRVRTMAGENSEATSEIRAVGIRGVLETAQIISINYNNDKVKVFWKQVPGAVSYMIQLSNTTDFKKITRQELSTQPSISLRLDKQKRYYIRVKAVSSELFTSEYGPHRELQIVE